MNDKSFEKSVSIKKLQDTFLTSIQGKKKHFPIVLGIDDENSPCFGYALEFGLGNLFISDPSGDGSKRLIQQIMWGLTKADTPDDLQFMFLNFKEEDSWDESFSPYIQTSINGRENVLEALEEIKKEIKFRSISYCNYEVCTRVKYNEKIEKQKEYLPYKVIFLNEMEDLLTDEKDREDISRLLFYVCNMSNRFDLFMIITSKTGRHAIVDGALYSIMCSQICFRASKEESRHTINNENAANLQSKDEFYYLNWYSKTNEPIHVRLLDEAFFNTLP